jgi:hypothetical protein
LEQKITVDGRKIRTGAERFDEAVVSDFGEDIIRGQQLLAAWIGKLID